MRIQVASIFVFKDELKTHIGFHLPHSSPAPLPFLPSSRVEYKEKQRLRVVPMQMHPILQEVWVRIMLLGSGSVLGMFGC